jgi:hypothetical protein
VKTAVNINIQNMKEVTDNNKKEKEQKRGKQGRGG